MAHLLLGAPYRKAPFLLLEEDENALIAGAAGLTRGDLGAVELLVHTLVMSGFGMTICGSSAPASQGEHLIAHYIDMRGEGLPRAYHGEHIAVTTMTMLRLQERMINRDRVTLAPSRDTPGRFAALFGAELGAACWRAYRPKVMDERKTAALNAKLAADWPEIRRALAAVARPASDVEAALRDAGAPTTPALAGIPDPFYEEAVLNARRIRDRYTMLDLADAAGELGTDVVAAMISGKAISAFGESAP
jgi:glycerol-1-phosphate dehydrogenase [NAD(P)+]